MSNMFYKSEIFDQDISNWIVDNCSRFNDFIERDNDVNWNKVPKKFW
ncbi:hypothetical protein [Mycoplasma sp. HU2014]|nr:hypothetical protein [Mycoplasma sp. HU2014]